ncbi:murein hydrolase activator EnvC family protein [Exiguobacterium flavidum]|uniref:murein hydrolase activator EnvC family protein n=1 Tax=Exiguobacterium flavidum TaxID=2184695 RepID=UPI000DF8471D|nr:M23 family metallopeptidase [Exiguobacterium flavidum]
MKKTLASLVVSALIITSAPFGAEAESLKEKEARNAQEQRQNKKKQSQLESHVHSEGEKISKTQEEVNRIDTALNEKIFAIAAKDREIKTIEREIAELDRKIKAYQLKLKKQEALLGDRLRVMQENDGNSIKWEEVIFGSKDVGDLVSRVFAGKSIAEQDNKMIVDYRTTQEKLSNAQAEQKQKKAKLVTEKENLKAQKADLEKQLQARNEKLKELRKRKAKFETQLVSTREASQILIAQERAIAAEKAAQAREAREAKARAAQAAREAKARAEAEAAQAAQAKQAAKQSAKQSYTPSAPSAPKAAPAAPKVAAPAASSSLFIRPTGGGTTQGYGAAGGGNGYTFHNGLDFGGPVGSPIVAAATGTVILAQSGGPYGNHVMIAHQLNGQTYTTVYAHMNSLNVSSGQRVSQGQQIGTLGSTGNSTGPHLHFEIHVGGYVYSGTGPANSVNPNSML